MAVLHRPVPAHRPRVHPPLPPATAPRTRPARRVPPRGTLARDLALPLGAVGAALLVTALTLTGPGARAPLAPAVFALLTVAVAALARPAVVPGVALVSWLFYDGFVLNGHAELAFGAPDRTGLVVLGCAAAAGGCGAAALRALRRRTAG
ncbi:DUF4118 domain-containing protein [Streptomyces kronopolitis]|uniref:DUF4118 domain-containing protein n=1 Tax=Streptomyces kronopolitis TaxID=1612435 RepID=UPI0034492EE1